MGGNFNANTREGLTQYLFTVPSEDLDIALHIESTRMRDVNDSDKDWDEERGAIEQEVAQDLPNPGYVMFEKLRQIMFAGTPYEHDALGTRPSFDKTTGAMLKNFYTKWYAPNNAILVVVGDIDPQATLTKIRDLFGSIARKSLPAHPAINPRPVLPSEPRSWSPQIRRMDRAYWRCACRVSTVRISLRWKCCRMCSTASAAISMRLCRRAKRSPPDFSLDPLDKSSLAYASIAYPADADAKTATSELRMTLQKILHDGVPPELVDAAKTQEERQAEFEKNSIAGLANVWSEAVAVYHLRSPDDDLERIKKVTVADVNRVARQYLDLDHAVTAVLTPRGAGRPVASSGFGGQESISLGEAQPTKLARLGRKRAFNRLNVPPATVHPVVSTLPNGLTLMVQPEDVSDSVMVYGHIKNRSELEVPAWQGGHVAGHRRAVQLRKRRNSTASRSRRLWTKSARRKVQEPTSVCRSCRAISIAAWNCWRDNELHPAFPAGSGYHKGAGGARRCRAAEEPRLSDAARVARGAVSARPIPPCARPRRKPCAPSALDDVKNYYRIAFRPDLTTIVWLARSRRNGPGQVVEKYFGAWTATGPKPPTDLPTVAANKPAVVAVPDQSRVQDQVVLAETIGLTRSDPGLLRARPGQRGTGRQFLFHAAVHRPAQERRSGLLGRFGCAIPAGLAAIISWTMPAIRRTSRRRARWWCQELKRMQDTPVGADELQRVKALMLRQIPLGEASVNNIARGLAGRWDLGLPLDEPINAARHYIALTPAEIQAAFKKWIRPDDLVRVSQGPTPQ